MSDNNLRQSKFGTVLTRNNKQIRDERAIAIIEDAELEYKRSVENMERDLKTLKREREAMLDLSPGNSYSLTPEKFDTGIFVKKHVELGIQIREMEIKLDIAQKGYNELFVAEKAEAIA